MTPSEEWNRLTLLEKLRKLNVGEFQPGLYAEAADEIERLQAENQRNADGWQFHAANGERLKDEIERLRTAIRALKAQHVVSSAPQPTTEGFFAMGDPEKTDLAAELGSWIDRALGAGADVEEVKALLNEAIEELEAQEEEGEGGGEYAAEEPKDGESS